MNDLVVSQSQIDDLRRYSPLIGKTVPDMIAEAIGDYIAIVCVARAEYGVSQSEKSHNIIPFQIRKAG